MSSDARTYVVRKVEDAREDAVVGDGEMDVAGYNGDDEGGNIDTGEGDVGPREQGDDAEPAGEGNSDAGDRVNDIVLNVGTEGEEGDSNSAEDTEDRARSDMGWEPDSNKAGAEEADIGTIAHPPSFQVQPRPQSPRVNSTPWIPAPSPPMSPRWDSR